MEGLGPVRLRSVLLSSYSYGGPGTCETEVCTVVIIQLWRAWDLLVRFRRNLSAVPPSSGKSVVSCSGVLLYWASLQAELN